MAELATAIVAYGGVYAGVWLGSLSAEELPVGRYKLRVFQLVLLGLAVLGLLYDALVHAQYILLLFVAGLLIVELSYVIEHKVTQFTLRPKERILLTYGIFGIVVAVVSPGLFFPAVAFVFVYGLITGSLIAEPYVDDRRIVPQSRPYKIALLWTWTYPLAWFVMAVFGFM